MTGRVTHSTVEFAAPFMLEGIDESLPPGLYHLVTEHEAFELTGHTVHRRTATILRVERGSRIEHHTIDPAAMERALAQDRETSACLVEADLVSVHSPVLQGKFPWRSIPKWVRSNPFRVRE